MLFILILIANPYVVIKHQKGGDWKSISLSKCFNAWWQHLGSTNQVTKCFRTTLGFYTLHWSKTQEINQCKSWPAKIQNDWAVVPLGSSGSTAQAVVPQALPLHFFSPEENIKARGTTAQGYRASGSTALLSSGSTAWTVPKSGSTAKRRTLLRRISRFESQYFH